MRAATDGAVEELIQRYFRAVSQRSKTEWLALFAPDAVCHDPVGTPPAEGPEQLDEIWRVFTAPFSELEIDADEIHPGGAGAAVRWSANGRSSEGGSVEFEGITVFEMDDAKIRTVMAYWDPAEVLIRLADAVDTDDAVDTEG